MLLAEKICQRPSYKIREHASQGDVSHDFLQRDIELFEIRSEKEFDHRDKDAPDQRDSDEKDEILMFAHAKIFFVKKNTNEVCI